MAKQQPSQLTNLQTKAFKAQSRFFAVGNVSYLDKDGKPHAALDGEPIDPCDGDFELFMRSNSISDVDPKGSRSVPVDPAGDEGLEGL